MLEYPPLPQTHRTPALPCCISHLKGLCHQPRGQLIPDCFFFASHLCVLVQIQLLSSQSSRKIILKQMLVKF